jgi:hypothetical protein
MSGKSKNFYDIVIIGSGIAGLYSGYKIKKYSPTTKFVILEKYKKQWIGGRTGNYNFYGTNVVSGAGIGRKDTNPLLIKLLGVMKIPFKKTTSIMEYSKLLKHQLKFDVVKIIDMLKLEYEKNPNKYKHLTFKEFAILILGDINYKLFTIYAGYTDYENADIYETLYNYGMDDNKGGWPKLYISWKELVEHLCEYIDYKNIKPSNNVISVTKISDDGPCLFEIKTQEGSVYYSNKVIIATTISGIMKLVPGASLPNSLYKQIHGQPFLRLYAKFDKKSSESLKKYITEYTIVPGPLQKIIPMDSNKGVYMISYSDNECAMALKKHLENTLINRELYEKLVEESLGIPIGTLKIIALKDFYWSIGTHYFEPLHGIESREKFIYKVQHPVDGMIVVGEAVSTYQGWVEGALESVENIINKNWINKNC